MKTEDKLFYFSLFLLAVFTFLIRWILLSQTQFIADDALITYRYAENLVAGHGLVYNLGEKVLGTTTPLLTLLVSAAVFLGCSAKIFSPIFNMLCDSLVVVLIALFFRKYFNRPYFGIVVGGLYALFPSPWVWSISGMEVSLYALCVLACLYFFLGKRYNLSFLFFGLALLTRIDALVLGVALVLTLLLQRERIGWKPLLTLLLVVMPWLIVSTYYYGSPVPNSVIAKKVFYGALPQFQSSPLEIISGFIFGGKTNLVAAFYSPLFFLLFLILFVFAFLGVVCLLKKGIQYWILPLWLGGYVAFFIVGKTYMHPWYFAPYYSVYIPVIGIGFITFLQWVSKRFSRFGAKSFLQKGFFAFILLIGLIGASYETKKLTHLLGEYQKTEQFLIDMIYWVKDRTDDQDKIYYSDIGKLGYFSNRYILDSVGIVSPVVTKYYRSQDWIGPIREVKPEIVLFAETDFRLPQFLQDKELRSLYKEINRFDYKKSKHYSNAVYSKVVSGVDFPIIIVYEKQI